MRILVCGGREFRDSDALDAFLDAIHLGSRGPVDLVIHGAARGADTMAGQWAERRGIACIAYEADWEHEGRAAGPIRNKQMLDEGILDLVIAFPGGRGTRNMVRQARARGFEVLEVA
jgi:hypothetical protein